MAYRARGGAGVGDGRGASFGVGSVGPKTCSYPNGPSTFKPYRRLLHDQILASSHEQFGTTKGKSSFQVLVTHLLTVATGAKMPVFAQWDDKILHLANYDRKSPVEYWEKRLLSTTFPAMLCHLVPNCTFQSFDEIGNRSDW